MMESFVASVCNKDAEVISENVLVRVTKMPARNGKRVALGSFSEPAPGTIQLGARYVIEADNGWMGEVIVTDLEHGPGRTEVKFETDGEFGRG